MRSEGSAEGEVLCRGSGCPRKILFLFRRRRRQEEAKPKLMFEVMYENTSQ